MQSPLTHAPRAAAVLVALLLLLLGSGFVLPALGLGRGDMAAGVALPLGGVFIFPALGLLWFASRRR